MKQETYQKMVSSVRKTKYSQYIVRYMDKLIVVSTILSYLLLLGYLYKTVQWEMLYHSILVPLVAFVGVSLFRRCYPSKRPYEEIELEPIIAKETKGKSFPSRHVFSIFMIAMTYTQVSMEITLGLCVAGVILAVLRVVAGVHYIKDVVAGMAMALLIGAIGYFVIF